MVHEFNIAIFVASALYSTITLAITISLLYNRIKKKIPALNYLIWIFGFITLTGLAQTFHPLLHDNFWLFSHYSGDNDPLLLNPVRDLGLIFMLITYLFAEMMLRNSLSPWRFSIMFSSFVGYIFVFVYYENTNYLIRVSDLFPFAQSTRLDELFYDIILFTSLLMITYVYYKQFQVSDDEFYRKNILYIVFGFSFFLLTYIIEISEHFFSIPDIDFVFFTLPMFLIIGYVYLRYPNFIFYTPIDISLLQISTLSGHLLYATEFKSKITNRDYLISIGLSGLNNMLGEIVDPDIEGLTINSIHFDKGVILFEKLNELVVIIQADHESHILRESIKYLIREFHAQYGPQIRNIEGGVMWNNFKEIDALLTRCIPMIQSKIIIHKEKQAQLAE